MAKSVFLNVIIGPVFMSSLEIKIPGIFILPPFVVIRDLFTPCLFVGTKLHFILFQVVFIGDNFIRSLFMVMGEALIALIDEWPPDV